MNAGIVRDLDVVEFGGRFVDLQATDFGILVRGWRNLTGAGY
jgi:hypothetical protein